MLQLSPTSPKSGSTFGFIAIGICVVSFFTIRLFLSIVLLGIVVFAILGLVKDSSKIWSICALIWCGLLLYAENNNQKVSSKIYEVEYVVECHQCKVEYTNSTGGKDQVAEVISYWRRVEEIKGDEYITLSAYGGYGRNQTVKATITVDGKILETKTSNGEGANAFLGGIPNEVNNQ